MRTRAFGTTARFPGEWALGLMLRRLHEPQYGSHAASVNNFECDGPKGQSNAVDILMQMFPLDVRVWRWFVPVVYFFF